MGAGCEHREVMVTALIPRIDTMLRPSLEPVLRCPNTTCARMVFRADPELYVGALTCERCGTHWWATRFHRGDVRVQLSADFYGDAELVDRLMHRFHLPPSIDRAMYWQVRLTGNQLYRYNKDDAGGMRGRSIALLRRLTRPA